MSIDERIGLIEGEEVTATNLNIRNNFGVETLDTMSRFALTLLIAGYRAQNKITVFGEDLGVYIDIQRFGNLNLNFKKAAPMEFDLQVTFEGEEEVPPPTSSGEKTIVLSSGGLDSVAGTLYAVDEGLDCVPFWLGFGQRNELQEEESVAKASETLGLELMTAKIGLGDFVKQGWNTWKLGIVPARNFLILAMAGRYIAQLPEENITMYLCASRDELVESHNDTSPEFYDQASQLMSGFYKRNITVKTPFANVNKADIIRFWDDNWTEYGLSIADTTTCFLGTHCGGCSSDYYRRVNALAAGVDDRPFESDPMMDRGGLMRDYYLPSFEGWGQTRQVDFMIALSRVTDVIPTEIRDFYESRVEIYADLMQNRIEEFGRVEIK